MARKLIVGCGYLGLRVARRWLATGHEVIALTRSVERAAILRAEGIAPIIADVTQINSLAALPEVDAVLYSVGHDRHSATDVHEVYVRGLEHVLALVPQTVRRLLYVSTTGVYGPSDDWLDESAACAPVTDGAKAHLAAEQLLQQHPLGQRTVILRMGGLYGPGRLPRREELLAGQPIPAASGGWLNLIHIDDAAFAVVAADERATAPRTYNVTDGHPVPRREYLAELARLLGVPPPRFIDPPADAPRRRGESSKRVSNARLLAELPISLQFPSFHQGLVHSAAVKHSHEQA